jgi:hypothetical protein
MPVSRVGGVNGSVSLTGINMDFAGFEVTTNQVVEDDTAYGDSAASKIGNGLPETRVVANGFLRKGAASSSPGHVAGFGSTGGTGTLTYDSGCTITGLFIAEQLVTTNARRQPASTGRAQLLSDGAITETWATN